MKGPLYLLENIYVLTKMETRDFTEEEYRKELTLHHIKIEKGKVPSRVYWAQPLEVRQNPRSGVFRDFVQYGVYPARVIIQKIDINVPFIVENISYIGCVEELRNRGQNMKNLQKVEERFKVFPTPDDAFRLVTALREDSARGVYRDWTTEFQMFMSAMNYYLFTLGNIGHISLRDFLTPDKERVKRELIPRIPIDVMVNEIYTRTIRSPGKWGKQIPTEATIDIEDAEALVNELRTNDPYTSNMRQIVTWYKEAFLFDQMTTLLRNVISNQDRLKPILRIS